ncbi:Phospholipid-transporting ATPase abca7, variant 2, partial [Stylosanthes scabra]|nr:Phospholipid-transporting ATPase abca7, variant 2 [Stylosanthes scabra]
MADLKISKAVEDSLKSLNLFNGGVANKQAGKYSGGMKRRLSVAISLIGNPSVVYIDEPSTELDPASRKRLWDVIKTAKKDRPIILTTHSMEEAEALCDRLGIFVDGSLQCIGNPKEVNVTVNCSWWNNSVSKDYSLFVTCPIRQGDTLLQIAN